MIIVQYDFNQNRLNLMFCYNVNMLIIKKDLCKIDQFDLFEDVINNTYGKVISSQISLKYLCCGKRICSVLLALHQTKVSRLLLLEFNRFSAFKNMDINQFNIVRYNIPLIMNKL